MRKNVGKCLPLLCSQKMMKNWCETPIDVDLVKKITKAMCTLFNSAVNLIVKNNKNSNEICKKS